MSRQRMYLFERAYVDYARQVRRFIRRIKAFCLVIWSWFWKGKGSVFIEYLLRLGIVVSAVTVAALYVRYESSRGRGFSATTFFVMSVIAIYVAILMWGWKTPLQYLTKAISAAGAAGCVFTFALLALVAFSVVFFVYLAVLFSLTAISFLIFVPMRLGHYIWLLHRQIAYTCPYDDCPNNGLPVYICDCGQSYADLYPSFYGIFFHTCRHDDRSSRRLPTMDFLGRKKLDRRCGKCGRPLVNSSLGELPELPIVIVGGANVGKTVYLLQATQQLQQKVEELPNGKFRIDSNEQLEEYNRLINDLREGRLPPATTQMISTALNVSIRLNKNKQFLLYLFDSPGEKFADFTKFAQMQAMQHMKGLILLVDPFSLPLLMEQDIPDNAFLKPSHDDIEKIVTNLRTCIDSMTATRFNRVSNLPIAVVITKIDCLSVTDFPFIRDILLHSDITQDGQMSNQCRDLLLKLGAQSAIMNLENKFKNIHYFACSALGRLPDFRNKSPFQAIGVLEPIVWLLDDNNR